MSEDEKLELLRLRVKVCKDRADKARILYKELESEYCEALDKRGEYEDNIKSNVEE